MKALTIKQPWAGLILVAGKDIENRNWPTNFRGRVAIHASARAEDTPPQKYAGHPAFTNGAVVGTVEIVDCVYKSDSEWFFGPYGYVLRNPVVFDTPIPAKGQLGFWEWDAVAANQRQTPVRE